MPCEVAWGLLTAALPGQGTGLGTDSGMSPGSARTERPWEGSSGANPAPGPAGTEGEKLSHLGGDLSSQELGWSSTNPWQLSPALAPSTDRERNRFYFLSGFFSLIIKLPLSKSCLGLELIVITLEKSVCTGRDLLTAPGCPSGTPGRVPSTARCCGTCQHCRDDPLEPPSRLTLAQIPPGSSPPGMGRGAGGGGFSPRDLHSPDGLGQGRDTHGTGGAAPGCPACPLSPSPPG